MSGRGNMAHALTFSPANAKLRKLAKHRSMRRWLRHDRHVYSFDLLSGWACPFANACLSKVQTRSDGTRYLEDGARAEYRCFSASQEAVFTATYAMRTRNFTALRTAQTTARMYDLLSSGLPDQCGVLRLHVAGDFFNAAYFRAIVKLARAYPDRLFYAYTKSLPYWIEQHRDVHDLDNLILTASYGGRSDHLIDTHQLRSVRVVYSTYAARQHKLPLDHDDSHAADPTRRSRSFALLIHGQQASGTDAQRAVTRLAGRGSYTRS